MFKIVYTSDGKVYGEYENLEDYYAAMEELAESSPYDIDDCGTICYIDDGDPF